MSLSPFSLPGGGSLALPSISVTPQGTLPHVDSSKIYSSFLVPSAGDNDEKTDSFITSRPDTKKMNDVEKELDEEQNGSDEDESSKRKKLIKEIEKNVLAKPGSEKEAEGAHKPNLDKIFSLKANDKGSESLHDSLKEERKSFITAAMHQKQIPLASEQIGSPNAKADSKSDSAEGKSSNEDGKPSENPDEKVPSIEEIEKNPSRHRSEKLGKNIHGVTSPPYASKNN